MTASRTPHTNAVSDCLDSAASTRCAWHPTPDVSSRATARSTSLTSHNSRYPRATYFGVKTT
ncbi:hypothetical protein AB0L53_53150 [Nonomuraea sp. NPDC052129]|uniref:hypothetical protein n=1 Tax=Nonomuraea sp. NPDC052129 TaxID=3154651 RepID=UPI003446BA47